MRITESQLKRIVKKLIKEQPEDSALQQSADSLFDSFGKIANGSHDVEELHRAFVRAGFSPEKIPVLIRLIMTH